MLIFNICINPAKLVMKQLFGAGDVCYFIYQLGRW